MEVMSDNCNHPHQTIISTQDGIEMDPSRYACTVLEESRAALEKLNWTTLRYSKRHLATLLEELQTIVNRMEAGLTDKADYNRVRDMLRDTRAELTVLRAEKAKLEREITTLKVVVQEPKDSGVDEELNSTAHDEEYYSSEEAPK